MALHRFESKTFCAFPPLARVERAPAEGRPFVHVLTMLRPEQGWPRFWAWLPVRWSDERGAQALAPAHLLPFERPEHGDPGVPLRSELPLPWFPPAPDCGLLCLFIYADLRAQQREGQQEPVDADLQAALARSVAEALAVSPVELRHAFVRPPGEDVAGAEGLSLVLAACQYPPGLLDHSVGAEQDPTLASPAESSLARLVAFTRGRPAGAAVSLLLLAGDQVYADASGGFFDPANSVERHHKPYQHFKAGLMRHLPPSLERIVHMPDDHEIQDNWEPIANPALPGGRDAGRFFQRATEAAWQQRWDAAPGRQSPHGRFWHAFDWRGAAFFMADSRTERGPRRVDLLAQAQLLERPQREALSAWLASKRGMPRFVLSGSLLLPRRRASAEHPASALRSDAWDGYPATLHWLLGELWAQRADGVVFLSGDEHRSGFVSACIEAVDGEPAPVRLHSIHSSGLYTPWPFAVTNPEDFAAPESFTFPGPEGQVLRCTVSAWADFPGDGFALLRQRGGALALWFDRAGRALHEGAALAPADGTFDLG
jgi:alkaline phosphatase D